MLFLGGVDIVYYYILPHNATSLHISHSNHFLYHFRLTSPISDRIIFQITLIILEMISVSIDFDNSIMFKVNQFKYTVL